MRLWAQLTGGLSGSQEPQEAVELGEAAGEWEDIDEETLSDSDLEESTLGEAEEDARERERKERIKKGQVARVAARAREVNSNNNCMPAKKDTVGSGKEGKLVGGGQEGTRRTSIGRQGGIESPSLNLRSK